LIFAGIQILGRQLFCAALLPGGHNHRIPNETRQISLISEVRTIVAAVTEDSIHAV
jgi:hypothetical protein